MKKLSDLDKENNFFTARTQHSAKIFSESRKFTPFGVHSNYRYADPYPLYFIRGRGSRIWDADDNEYVDFNLAFGSLTVGHAHPILVEAMKRRVEESVILGFEYGESPLLAKVISERFNLDMVRFSSTGLEASLHALRFARAYTGREKVIKFEGCYHGSHDYLLVSVKPTEAKAGYRRRPLQIPAGPGILKDAVKNTLVCPFNDLEAVEETFRRNMNEVAAIILEPMPMNMGFILPKIEFLEGLRKLCDEYGAVLIFDEIKTGSKFYGGAAEYFNVKPDIMLLGKALAGGIPLSVIGGKEEIFREVGPGLTAHAGTFNSNPFAIASGITTLTKILTRDALTHIAELGEYLAKGYKDVIEDSRLKARVQWAGPSGAILFTEKEVVDWRTFLKCNFGTWSLYYLAMINRGVIPQAPGPDEQWTISVQHTKEDIEKHLETFKETNKSVKLIEVQVPVVESL